MKFKKMMNVLLIWTMVTAIAVSLAPIESQKASAESNKTVFSDINRHWAKNTIVWAADRGIVKGMGDGRFAPDRKVTEAEFLAMLFNAFPKEVIPVVNNGPWFSGYYVHALSTMNWPVSVNAAVQPVLRGQVARIVSASQGKPLDTDHAIQFLLDHKLANGKTSATVAGFGKNASLTRAEAVSFVKNLLDQGAALSVVSKSSPLEIPVNNVTAPITNPINNLTNLLSNGDPAREDHEFVIRGIALGDSENDLLKKLGQPARKDTSEYGFLWYVYNQDYASYIQVGVLNGKVVALYSNALGWKSKKNIKVGSTTADVEKQYGSSLTKILKGRVNYSIMRGNRETDVFLLDNAYTTIFYDLHANSTVTAVLQIAEEVELSLQGYYSNPSKALSQSFERQTFDLVNALRVRMGLKTFQWADDASSSSRKHSEDMGNNSFFAHTNLQGKSPFDRMEAVGISFSSAGENIAAGQQSAIFAHEGWMNSEGHRKNVLANFKRLGVGVAFGDKMHIYYTQNFYTPMK
jgi:uncharacterized protein YkwD